jgi:hypothetical protein
LGIVIALPGGFTSSPGPFPRLREAAMAEQGPIGEGEGFTYSC